MSDNPKDWISEAEAYSSNFDGLEEEPSTEWNPSPSFLSDQASYEYKYQQVKKAPVGSKVSCPVCDKTFIKTTYNKTFCSNQKTTKRGKNSCKDLYHNVVSEKYFRKSY